MSSYIDTLLKAGEGQQLDYKQTVSNASRIARTMVSFANTKGGILLIGIRDNRSISGVESEDEVHMLNMAGSFYCKPEIIPQVREHEVDGKIILEARIAEGDKKPFYARDEQGKWWVYVRVEDKSILASKTTVDFMHRKFSDEETRLEMGTLEKEILAYIGSRSKTTLAEICNRFNLGRRRVSRILVDLMSLDVVRSHTFDKTEFYTSK